MTNEPRRDTRNHVPIVELTEAQANLRWRARCSVGARDRPAFAPSFCGTSVL